MKISLIIYILLILLLCFLYIKISYVYEQNYIYKENFVTNNNIDTQPENNLLIKKFEFNQFINPFEFKKKWLKIMTNYIDKMNIVNVIARGYTTEEKLLEAYTYSLYYGSMDFSNKINLMFLSNQDKIHRLQLDYLNFMIPKIKIAHVSDDLDNGYPHTHENIIMFTKKYFNNPDINTFIHELVHIDQRLYNNFYEKLYFKLGFIKYKVHKIKNLEQELDYLRINPDGLDIEWIWNPSRNNYFFLGAFFFKNKNVTNLGDVSNNLLILNKNITGNLEYNNDKMKIEKNNQFTDYFGDLKYNNYHPNEILAEIIANYPQNHKKYKNIPAYKIIYKEFKKRFENI